MNPELEAYVARAQDPRLIPGIYNYGDHRCERCPFTTRCFSFREEDARVRAEGDCDFADHVEANVELTAALIHSWCERDGIDMEIVRDEANSEAVKTSQQRADHAADSDPLQIAAWQYSKEAYGIVEPLKNLSGFHTWPSGVATAIDAIAWHSGMIPAKVYRALHGLADQGRLAGEDRVQNDWNGSAKVARLAIAESLGAWKALFAAGDTPPDGSIRQTARLLEGIDRDLEERFPLAMDFVRPGFDEPDVAAGALAKLAPFEPRHLTPWRRLRAWGSRVLGRLDWSGDAREQRVPRAMVLCRVSACAGETPIQDAQLLNAVDVEPFPAARCPAAALALGGQVKSRNLSTVQIPHFPAATETGEFYFVASSVRKSVCTLVRQLRGPHLSTCA